MIDIYNASLADILPESLTIDRQFVAIAKALDPLLQKFAKDTRKAMHLQRLDELEGIILDVLAEQFHVDFYDSVNLDDAQKRNLIRNSIALHRRKGTVWAVEQVTKNFFRNPQVEELDGFLFRLKTQDYTATPDAFQTFIRMLWDAKPVRSWLVSIDLDLSPPPSKIYVGNPLIHNATTSINLPKVKGSKSTAYVGNIIMHNATTSVDRLRPKGSLATVYAGCPLIINRQIWIDAKREVARMEPPIADIAISY